METPFRHDFGEVIWQLMPDTGGGWLAVLSYDAERRGGIHVLDLGSGNVSRITDRDFAWHNILGLEADVLVLEEMQAGGLPGSKCLIGLDLRTGVELWRMEGLQFKGLLAGGILLRDHGLAEQLLDLSSGKLIQLKDPEVADLTRARAEARASRFMSCIQFPVMLHPGHPELDRICQAFGLPVSGQLFHAALENGTQVLAWHEGAVGEMRLMLAWGHSASNLEFVTLQSGMNSMNPEPFFVFQGQVIAIMDRTCLLVFRA